MSSTDERLQRALERAHRYVDRRERTVGEVRAHLERHETDAAAIQAAIEFLVDTGSLDDGRYARLFAQDKRELEQALELLRRRFPSPPRDRRDRDRALGVLLRKGYDSELALDALSAYARDAGAPSYG